MLAILRRFGAWLDSADDRDDLDRHAEGLEPVEQDPDADVACGWDCTCQPGQRLT